MQALKELDDRPDVTFRAKHPQLDAGRGEIGGKDLKRLREAARRDGLDRLQAKRGLDCKSGESRESEEAVRGKDRQIGRDPRTRGWIVAGNRQEGLDRFSLCEQGYLGKQRVLRK